MSYSMQQSDPESGRVLPLFNEDHVTPNNTNIKPPTESTTPPPNDDSMAYTSHEAFLSHLDSNPEGHFLAPVHLYEYEDWAASSDESDDEDFEWDAGITDFSLFHSDRRQAEESNKPLPSKWNDLLDKQTSALERAQRRTRANSSKEPDSQLLTVEDLPSLTPDDSPSLRDDLDVDSYHGSNEPDPSVPNYLTISVTPPPEEDTATSYLKISSDAAAKPQRQLSSHAERKQQRPGLAHSRTMSGQVHAWRRPSTDMYTVGEEPDNERREELIDQGYVEAASEEVRGRCRGRS